MQSSSGKATIFAIAVGVVIFATAIVLDPFAFSPYLPQNAQGAGTATTTVTVTNTPPQWSVQAQELGSYTTSTPVNAGLPVSFIGTGISSNGNRLYLLICKTSTAPTPQANSAPLCAGGAPNLWAVSASTTSGVQMTSTYVTQASDPEANNWWGFLCDGDQFNPLCNGTYYQGTSATNSSPFVINHAPNFTSTLNTTPSNPGATVTWTTTSSDPDSYGGQDQVKLWVCKSNDYQTSTCGSAGTWCSSTFANSNPTCSSTLPTPDPWGNYNAYTYVLDNEYFGAVGAAMATNSPAVVNDIAPTISSSSISLLNTSGAGPMVLANPGGQTNGFRVTFTVSDLNSCMTQGGGQEIASASINIYRSGITQANCQTVGQYNPNNCYPAAIGTSTWGYSCSQDGGACAGTSSQNVTWTCTFPLWYLADATDGTTSTQTQYYNQVWQTSVRAIDSGNLTSTLVEAATGNDLATYVAFSLNTAAIPYGSLAPGSSTITLNQSTTITSQGNTGLDQTIYGDNMCVSYPGCNASSTTSTIQIWYQKYATSSVGYGSSSAIAATSSPGAYFSIHILKPTQTSSPTFAATWWGILVSSSITQAGNYSGQNTILGINSSSTYW
ncbi:MAG TPA: hypothetical protein VMC43_03575 [Candidatus Paceibacterota bacterium]|nr:hypothetical protein [Candidatus Paceibacterota bacterium]